MPITGNSANEGQIDAVFTDEIPDNWDPLMGALIVGEQGDVQPVVESRFSKEIISSYFDQRAQTSIKPPTDTI